MLYIIHAKVRISAIPELSIVSHCCPDVEFQNHYNFNQYSQLQSILAAIDLNRDL
jgi:hypothetical protein